MQLKNYIIKAWVAVMAIILLPLSAYADDEGEERGITIGASFGIFRNYSSDLTEPIITPRIGYRFNNKWEAGAIVKYHKVRAYSSLWAFGGYGQWTVLGVPRYGFRLFVDLSAYYGSISGDYDDDNIPSDSNTLDQKLFEAGFTPGVAYRIPNTPIDLTLRYLFIGINTADDFFFEKGSHGCLGKGDWILDAGLRRLELGVAVNF